MDKKNCFKLFPVLDFIYSYKIIMSASTFKNVIPKRKYRERSQLTNRAHLGLLQKKQDYKQRAKNYHRKQDMINKLKEKADLKNQEQFYFKMMKGKRNEEGKFVQNDDESDSDFDEKDYRTSLKTQNYGIVQYQRSITQQKIGKLKGELHLLQPEVKLNQNAIFVDSYEQLNNFKPQQFYNTSKELVQTNLLDIAPQALTKPIDFNVESNTLKNKYNRLSQEVERDRKLTKLLLKIGYQKAVLGKERSKIKSKKGKKIHKFFIERKK